VKWASAATYKADARESMANFCSLAIPVSGDLMKSRSAQPLAASASGIDAKAHSAHFSLSVPLSVIDKRN
jgi:hypothetical protein